MSGRADVLINKMDQTTSELIDMLTELTEADMRLPCDDPSGHTVGELIGHLQEKAPAGFVWLSGVVSGGGVGAHTPPFAGHTPPPHAFGHVPMHSVPPAAAVGESKGSSPALVDSMIQMLRARRERINALFGSVTDEQLDTCPPATAGITDGTKTLFEILNDTTEHQGEHLTYFRAALAKKVGDGNPAVPHD